MKRLIPALLIVCLTQGCLSIPSYMASKKEHYAEMVTRYGDDVSREMVKEGAKPERVFRMRVLSGPNGNPEGVAVLAVMQPNFWEIAMKHPVRQLGALAVDAAVAATIVNNRDKITGWFGSDEDDKPGSTGRMGDGAISIQIYDNAGSIAIQAGSNDENEGAPTSGEATSNKDHDNKK